MFFYSGHFNGVLTISVSINPFHTTGLHRCSNQISYLRLLHEYHIIGIIFHDDHEYSQI